MPFCNHLPDSLHISYHIVSAVHATSSNILAYFLYCPCRPVRRLFLGLGMNGAICIAVYNSYCFGIHDFGWLQGLLNRVSNPGVINTGGSMLNTCESMQPRSKPGIVTTSSHGNCQSPQYPQCNKKASGHVFFNLYVESTNALSTFTF